MKVTLEQAAERLRSGDVVAFPTETVYGLGADVRNPQALQKIFNVKGRPSDNPLIVHLARIDQAWELAQSIPPAAKVWMETFWPGPLALVLPKKAWVPDVVTAGLASVALRVPAHSLALQLLDKTGPLAAPSANRSGGPSPTRADHVEADFNGAVGVLDGGACQIGLESTVVDCTVAEGEPFRILRPGAITAQALEQAANSSLGVGAVSVVGAGVETEVVGSGSGEDVTGWTGEMEGDSREAADSQASHDVQVASNLQASPDVQSTSEAPKSPGMRYTHYKPSADVRWLTGQSGVTPSTDGSDVDEGDTNDVELGASQSTGFSFLDAPALVDAIRMADESPCLMILHSVKEPEGIQNRVVHVHGDFSTLASLLYDLFRWADQMKLKTIWIEPLPLDTAHGMIPALRNRIVKAVEG